MRHALSAERKRSRIRKRFRENFTKSCNKWLRILKQINERGCGPRAGCAAGLDFPKHEPMKPLSIIKVVLLACGLFTSLLHAQESSEKVREIEQKVLRKNYQNAIDSLVGSAREATATPDLIGKRLQWVAMVGAKIEAGGERPAANPEDTRSARALNELAWKMIISADAGARHPEIALKLADIAIELGGEDESLKPDVLDTKARTLFLLERHAEAIVLQEQAIAAATVAEKKAGFEARLAAYKKGELPEIVHPQVAEPLSGTAYLVNKLRTIVIPMIDFENVTVEEAVDFLRLRAKDLDKAELDPSKKGVNFVIRRPRPAASPAPAAGAKPVDKLPDSVADPGSIRITELRLRNVPLAVALKYICDSARLRYRVDDFAVTLVHVDAPEDLFTRVFRVPLDFASKLNSGKTPADPAARPPIIELLKSNGINFGEGSSVTLTANGVLMVTNTPSQLDKIEVLINVMEPGGR
jgi:hypothetical protein